METPQPDPSDKRLPGIISSFFGQVGLNPSSKREAQDSLAVTTPLFDSGLESHPPQHHREARLSRTSSTSSGSLVMVSHGRDGSPPESHDEQDQKRTMEDTLESVPTKLPPTPISSASSFLQRETPSATNGQPEIEVTLNPVAQALKNFVLSPSSLKCRRHASVPVSSISVSPVLAAHISNPSNSSHQTAQGSPTASAFEEHDKLPNSTSVRELRKLTSSAAAGSRLKNTPLLLPEPYHTKTATRKGNRPFRVLA